MNQQRKENKIVAGSGFMMPFDEEIEKVVLGAMLLEKPCLRLGLGLIPTADAFYREPHRLIFSAMQQLFKEGKVVDMVTVSHELRRQDALEKAGGAYGLTVLSTSVVSGGHLEGHIHILKEYHARRLMITLSQRMMQDALDSTVDAFDTIANLAKGSSSVLNSIITNKPKTLATIYTESIPKIQAALNMQGLTGVPSGIGILDRIMGGWQASDLTIVAARPGMGKTAFALQIAKNAAIRFSKRVAIFSLEMSSFQLTKRLISSETEYTGSEITRARFGLEGLETIVNDTDTLITDKITIDDTAGLSYMELRTKALQLHADYGLELIIIDYLQLMQGDKGGTRENEIASISRNLKMIAKELNIPVIALSQLSRSVESRGGDKKPMLSDLRESGAIEQDADNVIFLYRPEYYDITEDELGQSTIGTMEAIIAKHRNGSIEDVVMGCDLAYCRVYDLMSTSRGRIKASLLQQLSPPDPRAFSVLPKSDEF